MNGLLAQVATYHGTTLEFTELLRVTHSFTNVCRSDVCLFDGCVCWFTQLWPWKWLEHLNSIIWVSQYFWQY